jgi:hypothetical protein
MHHCIPTGHPASFPDSHEWGKTAVDAEIAVCRLPEIRTDEHERYFESCIMKSA